jgi:hypothetical protein
MLPGAGKVLPEPPAADDGDERRGDDAEGRDSEEDADGNALVPVFRSFIKKNGALCCVFGLAMFVVLLVQAAVQWNMRPAWVKKVPCVLQPKLASIEGVLKAIDRYFIVTSLVPPLATVAYIAHHLVSTRKLPNSDYEPPKTKWMILIWSWKILTPLLVYIFIQVVCSCVAVLYSVAGKGLPPLTVLARTGQGRHLRGIRGDGAEAVRGLAQPHLLSARSHAAATATRARPTQKHKTPSKAGPVPGIQASNIIRIITQRCALSLA